MPSPALPRQPGGTDRRKDGGGQIHHDHRASGDSGVGDDRHEPHGDAGEDQRRLTAEHEQPGAERPDQKHGAGEDPLTHHRIPALRRNRDRAEQERAGRNPSAAFDGIELQPRIGVADAVTPPHVERIPEDERGGVDAPRCAAPQIPLRHVPPLAPELHAVDEQRHEQHRGDDRCRQQRAPVLPRGRGVDGHRTRASAAGPLRRREQQPAERHRVPHAADGHPERTDRDPVYVRRQDQNDDQRVERQQHADADQHAAANRRPAR